MADRKTALMEPRCTVVSAEDEAVIAAFVGAYNLTRRLKTLRGFTPYEAICKA